MDSESVPWTRVGSRGEPLPDEHEGPPDSARPYGLCPRCRKQSAFKLAGYLPITFGPLGMGGAEETVTTPTLDRVSSMICLNCNQGVAVVEERGVDDASAPESRPEGAVAYRGVHWWPVPVPPISADVPAEIAGAFREAVACLGVGAARAAAYVAQRALLAIAEDSGETQGPLARRFEALAQRGDLPRVLVMWATGRRLPVEAPAPHDALREMPLPDARDLVRFLQEMIRYRYDLPAELAKTRGAA